MWSKIDNLTRGKTKKIYKEVLDSINDNLSPYLFIKSAYDYYLSNMKSNPSVNGRIFEYLICETLVHQNITPFYYQAKFTYIPNCDFDIVLYNFPNPIILSIKTSLRERYKQADLEGIALHQVYRQAKQYLITLNKKEADRIKSKITKGEITGLDDVIIATDPTYDDFLKKINLIDFHLASQITPITGTLFEVATDL